MSEFELLVHICYLPAERPHRKKLCLRPWSWRRPTAVLKTEGRDFPNTDRTSWRITILSFFRPLTKCLPEEPVRFRATKPEPFFLASRWWRRLRLFKLKKKALPKHFYLRNYQGNFPGKLSCLFVTILHLSIGEEKKKGSRTLLNKQHSLVWHTH